MTLFGRTVKHWQLEKETNVYRKYGYTIRPTTNISGADGRDIMSKNKRYIRFRGKSDRKTLGGNRVTKITLSPFPSPNDNPVTVWSSGWPERSFSIGFYDHADFKGTIEYVKNTEAQYVLTDTRGQYAFELAAELRGCLGIKAKPSAYKESIEWGK